MFRKAPQQGSGRKQPVFIDLADYPVTDTSDGKKIKVLRPADAGDLRPIKSYIVLKITVIVDFANYSGDLEVARTVVQDLTKECAGNMWSVNPLTLLVTPFDMRVDNKQ